MPLLLRGSYGLPVPAAPSSVTVDVAGPTQLDISWVAVPGASRYQIYRFISGVYTVIATGTFPSLSYADSGLTPSTNYCYEVQAQNASGLGPMSGSHCATTSASTPPPSAPAPPSSVTATTTGATTVTVAWSNVPAADYYNVYESFNGNVFGAVAAGLPSGTLSYDVAGLESGQSYCYKIHAANAGGESADSPLACTTTEASILSLSPMYCIFDYPAGTYRSLATDFKFLVVPSPASSQTTSWDYFYYVTFGFSGGYGGYIGLRVGGSGHEFIFAIWNSNGAWATAPGAVASSGIPTKDTYSGFNITWPTSLDLTHQFEFQLIESSTPHYWNGWVKDITTGVSTQIGYINVPSSWGRISPPCETYVEYDEVAVDCNQVPYSSEWFLSPTLNFDQSNPTRLTQATSKTDPSSDCFSNDQLTRQVGVGVYYTVRRGAQGPAFEPPPPGS